MGRVKAKNKDGEAEQLGLKGRGEESELEERAAG